LASARPPGWRVLDRRSGAVLVFGSAGMGGVAHTPADTEIAELRKQAMSNATSVCFRVHIRHCRRNIPGTIERPVGAWTPPAVARFAVPHKSPRLWTLSSWLPGAECELKHR
jgi:hypothetical protein